MFAIMWKGICKASIILIQIHYTPQLTVYKRSFICLTIIFMSSRVRMCIGQRDRIDLQICMPLDNSKKNSSVRICIEYCIHQSRRWLKPRASGNCFINIICIIIIDDQQLSVCLSVCLYVYDECFSLCLQQNTMLRL